MDKLRIFLKFKHWLILLFVGRMADAQNIQTIPIGMPVVIDKNFADTLTFTSKWDYPWYIVHDEQGHFENTLGDSITQADTIRLYHSANCITNHQGEHLIRYCRATIHNDTILLFFIPELPAYASSLSVTIINDSFYCDFQATYPMTKIDELLIRVITKQELRLNNSAYKAGGCIKGYIDVDFKETIIKANQKPFNRYYYFRGFFKTQLEGKNK